MSLTFCQSNILEDINCASKLAHGLGWSYWHMIQPPHVKGKGRLVIAINYALHNMN
jgi:hypothetical protein